MLAFKPQARVRNRRGEYQSIDFADPGQLGAAQVSGRGTSLSAQGAQRGQRSPKLHPNDITRAEHRLRTIE